MNNFIIVIHINFYLNKNISVEKDLKECRLKVFLNHLYLNGNSELDHANSVFNVIIFRPVNLWHPVNSLFSSSRNFFITEVLVN